MHEQSKNHISLIEQAQMLSKSPTAQDTFQPIPGLISAALGVTWGFKLGALG